MRLVHHLQHAVRFIPVQLMLNIYRGLRLHNETSQTQQQESGRDHVLAPSLLLRIALRAHAPDCGPP